MYFFFSSRRRHTRWPRDWSSDVCSSDLQPCAVHYGFTAAFWRTDHIFGSVHAVKRHLQLTFKQGFITASECPDTGGDVSGCTQDAVDGIVRIERHGVRGSFVRLCLSCCIYREIPERV